MREKLFYCPDCMVDFKIIVEPRTETEDELKHNYPESLKWLSNVKECPVCGSDLEEKS